MVLLRVLGNLIYAYLYVYYIIFLLILLGYPFQVISSIAIVALGIIAAALGTYSSVSQIAMHDLLGLLDVVCLKSGYFRQT